MNWEKLGKIFNVSGDLEWAESHAMIPTPVEIDNVVRVFYGTRGTNGQASISYFDVDKENPRKVIYESKVPILTSGETGCFDDCGVLPGSVIRRGNKLLMYYVGFNVRNTVPYSNAIGLAESVDNGETFQRVYQGAVVDRTKDEPFFSVSPCVYQKPDNTYFMWYASCTKWISVNDKKEALYHIKLATSLDGDIWERPNISCILPLKKDESNARPTIICRNGIYHMYYSYRGSSDFRDGVDSYRLGYATSQDGVEWMRKDDDCGITFSDEGWDSLMLAYPGAITVNGSTLLFYNGNGFGKTGIGVAKAII